MALMRKAIGSLGGYCAGAAGATGALGVALGDGMGYFGKLIDAVTAAPKFVFNAYDLYRHSMQASDLAAGIEKIRQGTGPAAERLNSPEFVNAWQRFNESPSIWSSLSDWDFSQAWASLGQSYNISKQLYEAAKDIDMEATANGIGQITEVARQIDFNSLWQGVLNFSRNVKEQPWETAAAAGTALGLGYLAAQSIKFWAHRGEGGWIDKKIRRLGERVYTDYHIERLTRRLEELNALKAKREQRAESGSFLTRALRKYRGE